MFIAIDIGNTSVKIGIFKNGELSVSKHDTESFRSKSTAESIFSRVLNGRSVERMGIASVVPDVNDITAEALRGLCGKDPVVIGKDISGGLKFGIDNPAELGADRIASAFAASVLCSPPVVVIDAGTATTLNFVSNGTIFIGGVIMPGLGMMAKSLSEHTSKLPDISLRQGNVVLGKNTGDNILSGIIYGTAGAVMHLIGLVEKKEDTLFKIALTGGYMEYLLPHLKDVVISDPYLTLKGIKFICERQQYA